MLRKVLTALLCGFAIAGQMRAQEVVVARETKPDTPEQGAPTSERTDTESGTSTEAKSQVRKKKSPSAALTVEQMRMAGALAAERLKGRTLQEGGAAGGSSSQTPAAETRNASGAAERVKKETRVEQTDASRASNSRTTKSEAVGPIRPTMIRNRRTGRCAGKKQSCLNCRTSHRARRTRFLLNPSTCERKPRLRN